MKINCLNKNVLTNKLNYSFYIIHFSTKQRNASIGENNKNDVT